MNRKRWPCSAAGCPPEHFCAAQLHFTPIFRVSSHRRPGQAAFPYSGTHRNQPLESTMNHLLKTVLLSAAFLSHHYAHAADLTILIDDVKPVGGNLMVALYNSPDGFLKKPAKGNGIPAAAVDNKVVFKDLPEGEYAFAIYHDANSNGKMDKNLIGMPTEDYAFSNNALGKMGPPSYDMAKFIVPAAGATVRVTLK
jgi:uncharacterized protein (DUF2141 family)